MQITPLSARIAAALCILLALPGCERLHRIGQGPELSPVSNPAEDVVPRTTAAEMPMPQHVTQQQDGPSSNSLWRPGSRTFLRDQRAAQRGDIITVLVSVQDQASMQNRTVRTRESSENMGMPRLLGLDASVTRLAPNAITPDRLVQLSSESNATGEGTVRRNESITLRVAAVITHVLPNGNLVLAGRQEMRVNNELRELTVSGMIRPADIASDNTIRHDRLAEARILYGGRGVVSDVQRPRVGQELLDIILPF